MVVPGQGVVAARSTRSTARTLHKSDCSSALKSVLKPERISPQFLISETHDCLIIFFLTEFQIENGETITSIKR